MAAIGLTALAAHRDQRFHLRDQFVVDSVIILQAFAINGNVTQLGKFVSGRDRPFVTFSPDPEALDVPSLSFWSGHTSSAFSLATAAGTVASMRGYRSAPWVWVAGLTFAAATGYLRVAADKHYMSDVLTGAAVGTTHRGGSSLPFSSTASRRTAEAVQSARFSRGRRRRPEFRLATMRDAKVLGLTRGRPFSSSMAYQGREWSRLYSRILTIPGWRSWASGGAPDTGLPSLPVPVNRGTGRGRSSFFRWPHS